MSTADEIKKLNDLLKERVITQEEFDLQKEKLLNSSTTTSTTDWLTLFLLTFFVGVLGCLLYTSPSPRDLSTSRMPSSA